jgi:hypothetical protein
MRYDKLSEMIRTIAREKLEENIKIRSSSRSHSMIGRYGRRKGEIRLAQEEDNKEQIAKAATGGTVVFNTNPVVHNSIDKTR